MKSSSFSLCPLAYIGSEPLFRALTFCFRKHEKTSLVGRQKRFFGAPERIRTSDQSVRSRVLYPLSYRRILNSVFYFTTSVLVCQELCTIFSCVFSCRQDGGRTRDKGGFPPRNSAKGAGAAARRPIFPAAVPVRVLRLLPAVPFRILRLLRRGRFVILRPSLHAPDDIREDRPADSRAPRRAWQAY